MRRRGSSLEIRAGTRRDAPTILALIRGLAEYERLEHEMEATIARIRLHGFGRRRYFETLLCFDGRRPIGFALYFFTYSTFLARPTLYLEDLFVVPDARGHGAGKALLGALARIASRRGCGRMEWAVLDWNAPAIGFYERLGARLRKDWILTRLTGEDLRRAQSIGGAGPTPPPVQVNDRSASAGGSARTTPALSTSRSHTKNSS